MDFMTALRYPFNSIAKVFTIVLALTIALVVCLALIVSSADWSGWVNEVHELASQPEQWMAENHDAEAEVMQLFTFPAGAAMGLLLLLLVFIVGGFWISGYSVAVVRAVMAGEELMPGFEHGKHLSDGLALFLASIVYGIAGCVVAALFVIVSNFGGVFALLGFIIMIGLFSPARLVFLHRHGALCRRRGQRRALVRAEQFQDRAAQLGGRAGADGLEHRPGFCLQDRLGPRRRDSRWQSWRATSCWISRLWSSSSSP